MTIVMVGVIIILVIFLFFLFSIYRFKKELKQDKLELTGTSINQKFNIIVEGLNEYCFQNKGQCDNVSEITQKIYDGISNQIIYLTYGAGILNIEWKYKYWQQEMIYENDIHNARNLSEIEQRNIVKNLIIDFNEKLEIHKEKINKSGIVSKVIDKTLQEQGVSKEQIKNSRDFLN